MGNDRINRNNKYWEGERHHVLRSMSEILCNYSGVVVRVHIVLLCKISSGLVGLSLASNFILFPYCNLLHSSASLQIT
jgi:hypothetical protein